MRIKKIDHIAINTLDIDGSIKFYTKYLGLRRLETVDMKDFELTYIEVPGGGSIELFDYGGRNPRVDRKDEDTGLRHLAFEVEGINEWERKLREMGVTVTLPLTELPELNARVVLFLDPNGVTIEFSEKMRGTSSGLGYTV